MNVLPFAPRGMSRQQAAAYVGCNTVAAFDAMRRRGILPGPIPGTRLWDKVALDRALDRLSGIDAAGQGAELTPYERWKAEQANARAA